MTAPGMVQPPGRGRLADGPGGAGACARACGPGARLRARSLAQHSQRSGPVPSTVLSFLHLASESPRAEGGGWSCPGHVGFCLRRGGLPGGCLGFRSPGRSVRVRRLGQTFAENRTTPHRPGELDLPRRWLMGVWGPPPARPPVPRIPPLAPAGGWGGGVSGSRRAAPGPADTPGTPPAAPGASPSEAPAGCTVPSCIRSCLHHPRAWRSVPGCPQVPGRGPAPGLRCPPKREPPRAAPAPGSVAGAPDTLGCVGRAGAGGLLRLPGCSHWHCWPAGAGWALRPLRRVARCHGVGASLGRSSPGASWSREGRGQPSGPWSPCVTRCVTRWWRSGWCWAVLAAEGQVCGADQLALTPRAGGIRSSSAPGVWEASPARGQGGQAGGQDGAVGPGGYGHRARGRRPGLCCRQERGHSPPDLPP